MTHKLVFQLKMQIDFEGNQTKNIEKKFLKSVILLHYNPVIKIIIQSGVCLVSLLYQHYFLSAGIVSSMVSLPIWITNLMYIIAIVVSGIKPLKVPIMLLNLRV